MGMWFHVSCAAMLLSVAEGGKLHQMTRQEHHRAAARERHLQTFGKQEPSKEDKKKKVKGGYSSGCADEKKAATAAVEMESNDATNLRTEYAKCLVNDRSFAEGEKVFEALVKEGVVPAVRHYANYQHVVRNDTKRAVALWRSALPDAESQSNLGLALIFGQGGDSDAAAEGWKHVEEAAQKNEPSAQFNMGMILLEGVSVGSLNVTKDKKSAMVHLLKAAQSKNTAAMLQLAKAMLPGPGEKGKKPRVKGALRWLTEAAELNDLQARYELGMVYKASNGVRQDLEKAFRHFKVAAEANHADSQYELALMYIYDDEGGSDAGFDDVLAKKWMKAAAEQGHPHAMHNYAHILLNYEDRRRVTKAHKEEDQKMAMYFYSEAGMQGVEEAIVALGAVYLVDKFPWLPKNLTKAAQYFGAGGRIGSTSCQDSLQKLAEKTRNPESLYQMGRLYEDGVPGQVAIDLPLAEQYYKEAEELGSVSALDRRAVLEGRAEAAHKADADDAIVKSSVVHDQRHAAAEAVAAEQAEAEALRRVEEEEQREEEVRQAAEEVQQRIQYAQHVKEALAAEREREKEAQKPQDPALKEAIVEAQREYERLHRERVAEEAQMQAEAAAAEKAAEDEREAMKLAEEASMQEDVQNIKDTIKRTIEMEKRTRDEDGVKTHHASGVTVEDEDEDEEKESCAAGSQCN